MNEETIIRIPNYNSPDRNRSNSADRLLPSRPLAGSPASIFIYFFYIFFDTQLDRRTIVHSSPIHLISSL